MEPRYRQHVIDTGGGKIKAHGFGNFSHVANRERFEECAIVVRKVAIDEASNFAAQALHFSAQETGSALDQLYLTVVVQRSGCIYFAGRQIGSVIESAGIAVASRGTRANRKSDSVAVMPFPPRTAHVYQNVAGDFLSPCRMPDAFRTEQPTGSVREFLRLLAQ